MSCDGGSGGKLVLYGFILLTWALMGIADAVADPDRPEARERERERECLFSHGHAFIDLFSGLSDRYQLWVGHYLVATRL